MNKIDIFITEKCYKRMEVSEICEVYIVGKMLDERKMDYDKISLKDRNKKFAVL